MESFERCLASSQFWALVYAHFCIFFVSHVHFGYGLILLRKSSLITYISDETQNEQQKHMTKANPRVLERPLAPPRGPGRPRIPKELLDTPREPRRSPWVPPPRGPEGRVPWGPLGPGGPGAEALRAGGLGKHGFAITRSALERHGLSKGCGLAVLGEAVRG